jgi:hypothetical protein
MLGLDSHLQIPPHVVSSKVAGSAVLLNTKTKKYFALDDVGMRFWDELKSGHSFRDVYETLLGEYDVTPNQLENDLLELVQHLMDTGLVELD